jgi:uncharacterized ferredoxin-like protein
MEKRKKINEAIALLNQTQDQTAFYRRMEKINESKGNQMAVRKSRLARRH